MSNQVTVLMSTYNGEKYLRQQIDSILHQTGVLVNLVVRDDGSSDQTVNILEQYQKDGYLKYFQGSNLKTARSFLQLLKESPESPYYAFSDQDDVWQPNKLLIAISSLQKATKTKDQPLLYAGNFQMTDRNLNVIDDGKNHYTTTTFANAIVYSCCTGCTMVMNQSLRNVIKDGQMPNHLLMHDDWIHKVCLAVGGKVIFDRKPLMYYRQHGNNVDGGIHTVSDKIKKIFREKANDSHIMSNQLYDLLKIYGDSMTTANYQLLKEALKRGKGNFFTRLRFAFDPKYKIIENPNLNHEFRVSLILNDW